MRSPGRRPSRYRLRLYVAGDTRNSAQAIANLSTLCSGPLEGRCQIEVIDVTRHPRRALNDGVLMTPMLVKLAPGPVRRIVGTLSETQTVLDALRERAV